jgi:hypothetical protein
LRWQFRLIAVSSFIHLKLSLQGLCFWQGASDEFIDANIQLAMTLARKLYETKGITSCLVGFASFS